MAALAAKLLYADKMEIPAVHLARHGEGVNKDKTFKDIYGWGSSTIVNILKSGNISVRRSTSKPASTLKTRKSIMWMKANGQFLRIPLRPLSIRQLLITFSVSEVMSGATRTVGARHIL